MHLLASLFHIVRAGAVDFPNSSLQRSTAKESSQECFGRLSGGNDLCKVDSPIKCL